jgi:UDP-N-acetyl-D-mannosaminuronic acid transferase (WecB/TagA/CpsF family)
VEARYVRVAKKTTCGGHFTMSLSNNLIADVSGHEADVVVIAVGQQNERKKRTADISGI